MCQSSCDPYRQRKERSLEERKKLLGKVQRRISKRKCQSMKLKCQQLPAQAKIKEIPSRIIQ